MYGTTKIDAGRYRHRSGAVIVREVREWDGRGFGGSMAGDPKVQWIVYEDDQMRVDAPLLRTLRGAAKWCDRNLASAHQNPSGGA